MKLKNLFVVPFLLSTVYMISCTASGTATIGPNPTPTPTPAATATPTPTPGVQTTFSGTLTGSNETPPVNTTATGSATLTVGADQQSGILNLSFQGLSSDQTGAHIHGPAAVGVSAGVLIPLPGGQISNYAIKLTTEQFGFLKAGQLYINVHTKNNTAGEIRAQLIMQ